MEDSEIVIGYDQYWDIRDAFMSLLAGLIKDYDQFIDFGFREDGDYETNKIFQKNEFISFKGNKNSIGFYKEFVSGSNF